MQHHPVLLDHPSMAKSTALISPDSISSLEDHKDLPPAATKKDLKILANGKVMKVQKARQRKILSCVYCHSKKIKCSRIHPVCNNCERLGIECKYFMNERVSRGGKKSARLSSEELERRTSGASGISSNADYSNDHGSYSSSDSISLSPETHIDDDDISAALIKMEEAMRQLMKETTPPQQAELSFATANPNIAQPQVSNSVLQTPILNNLSNNITNVYFNTTRPVAQNGFNNDELYSFNMSSFTFANNATAAAVENAVLNNRISNNNSPKNNHPLSHTNSSTNISSFFNKQAAALDSSTTSELFSPSIQMSLQNKQQPINPGLHNSLNARPSNPATTINYLYGTNNYYENDNLLDDLLKHMPTRDRSFELMARYLNSVHILLPLMINVDDFLKHHEQYWELCSSNTYPHEQISRKNSHHSGHSSPSSTSSKSNSFNYLQFYTLYFPILYASTISEFEEYDNLLLNQDIDKYLKGFNKICQYYNYPHGIKTIPLLLGNVIIQSTSPNPSTMEMSQIIRYAKFLQLHKDPLITLRISDWEVIKFRRQLWWVIFGLDALTSHNFCLPPVCKFEDFNVLMPNDEEPIFNEMGMIKEKKLNVGILSMNVKFKFDRILSELVYQLHNGLSANLNVSQINEIKEMIIELFRFINESIQRMNQHLRINPPNTVQEMNLTNFIKNHSWSFVDRALMLLHKKILLSDNKKSDFGEFDYDQFLGKQEQKDLERLDKARGGALSLSQYEDTFGHIQEANIIINFDKSSISRLKFNQYENFSYDNLQNNLIPSILHNLNDFLKYNDFIKFGKYNWYVKRTIPLDSIILMFIIITVKFKYEFMTMNELCIYVKLINKALFILNRKWFKNEKYKRMLSLTNLTWEFILKRYNVNNLITQFNDQNKVTNGENHIEFFDYQVTGLMNMNELFDVMDVPQPILNDDGSTTDESVHMLRLSSSFGTNMTANGRHSEKKDINDMFTVTHHTNNQLAPTTNNLSMETKTELVQLSEKISYDLRNNFVDVNDYCAFYTSLENILHELMDYVHKGSQ